MKFRCLFLLNAFFFMMALCCVPVSAEVIVEPYGTAIAIEDEPVEEFIITLANEGDAEVNFEIGIEVMDVVNPGDGQQGPRRDLPEGRFGLFQDTNTWGWITEVVFNRLNYEDYRHFNNANDLANADLDEFDALWIVGTDCSANFVQLWAENQERFEDYVDGGRCMFVEEGWNQRCIDQLPGGLREERRPQEGILVVGPEDNWMVEQMGWEEGTLFRCGNTTHVIYRRAAIEQIDNCDWFQIILSGDQDQNDAADLIYQYGRGFVNVSGQPSGHVWRNHWGQGCRWGDRAEVLMEWLVMLGSPRWIAVEPEEGVLEPDGDVDLNVVLLAEEMEVGTHYAILEIELDDPNQPLIQIPVMMSIDAPIFDLFGVVIDETNGETLRQVNVTTYPYDFRRRTDNNGEVEILALPSNEYDVHFSLTDYLPQVASFEVGDNDIINLEISMLHSQCNLNIEAIFDELDPGAQSETNFTVTNDGNGPLTYTTDRRLLGDANAEPWELRMSVPAGAITQDSRVQGAVFIEDNFYVAGANNRECQIYVLNRDLEIVNQYAQLGEANYGYKDLAWDGELIWGSGERVVYGFTPDGEPVTSFNCGISPCTNMVYDSERDILWVSGTTTDIFGFDREGNRVGTLPRQDLRVYGLAYWPDDPDGYQLYIYHKIPDIGDFLITKMDVENSDLMDVVSLQPEAGGAAQGCHITNQYDIYSWVFMGLANDGAQDRIDIWQIDARKDWMAIDPTEGVVEAGEQQDFVVTLDATGLPQALFEGEVVFLHDGVGGETHLPISLQVGEGGGGPEEMVLELANGWNMVSAYVQPDPDGIIAIMADLVEAGTLIMVKNGSGQFYNPQFGFNNIPGWMVDEGYMIKMDGADELTLTGEAVPWNQMIPLDAGWQMVSYYPRQGVNAILAFSGIVDVLLMAKDGLGRFYSPPFGFSNMGNLAPGQGYLLKMDEAAELVYTIEERLAAQSNPHTQPSILPVHIITSENMSLLVLSDITEGEIGVYTNGNLVGSGVLQDGKCGIAVWGDDPTTSQVDGALKGEALEIQLHDGDGLKNISFETVVGDDQYITNGFSVIHVLDVTTTPEQFGIVDTYPNPFNSSLSITYNLPEAANVEIVLFDLAGRQVADLVANHSQAGQHTLAINGAGLSSGVYVVQLQANGKVSKRKLTLLR